MGYTVQDLNLDNRLKINIDTNLWWLTFVKQVFFCKTDHILKYRNLGNLNSHVVGTSCNYPCVLVHIILNYKYIISYVKVHIFLCISTYILMYKYIYILMYTFIYPYLQYIYILIHKYLYPYGQVQYPYVKVNISLCTSIYIYVQVHISLCTSTISLCQSKYILMYKYIYPYVQVHISSCTSTWILLTCKVLTAGQVPPMASTQFFLTWSDKA